MKSKAHIKTHGTLRAYIIGFVLSLLLTLTAYFLVTEKLLTSVHTAWILSILALTQALIQLIFFLHLGQEEYPYWNLQTFLFMLGVLVIIVIGTIWIINNLDYHMMAQ